MTKYKTLTRSDLKPGIKIREVALPAYIRNGERPIARPFYKVVFQTSHDNWQHYRSNIFLLKNNIILAFLAGDMELERWETEDKS